MMPLSKKFSSLILLSKTVLVFSTATTKVSPNGLTYSTLGGRRLYLGLNAPLVNSQSLVSEVRLNLAEKTTPHSRLAYRTLAELPCLSQLKRPPRVMEIARLMVALRRRSRPIES